MADQEKVFKCLLGPLQSIVIRLNFLLSDDWKTMLHLLLMTLLLLKLLRKNLHVS